MTQVEVDKIWKRILALLKVTGLWYCTMNFKLYTGREFIEEMKEHTGEWLTDDESYSELEQLMLDHVEELQRNCDTYYIKLYGE